MKIGVMRPRMPQAPVERALSTASEAGLPICFEMPTDPV